MFPTIFIKIDDSNDLSLPSEYQTDYCPNDMHPSMLS